MTSGLYYATAGKDGELKTAIDNLLGLADTFARNYEMEIRLEHAVMADVIRNNSLSLDGAKVNSAYRQAGTLCAWLAKLKPIVLSSFSFKASKARMQTFKQRLNETFAIFAAVSILQADSENAARRPGLKDLTNLLWTPSLEDLLTELRYRGMSRHALALFFRTICERGLK